MTWHQHTHRLIDKIERFVRSAELGYRIYPPKGQGAADRLVRAFLEPTAKAIHQEVLLFRREFGETVPASALTAIDQHLERWGKHFSDEDLSQKNVSQPVTLSLLAGELRDALVDPERSALERTRLAFAHLQRLLATNAMVREAWEAAFLKGETACERIGATHLLLHGIWAFKANADGARTDLVLGSPIDDAEVISTGAKLVLTEWKLATTAGDCASKVREAELQTNQYSAGALRGFEVENTRFLIVVSKKPERLRPPYEGEGGIRYEPANIAVHLPTPSVVARSA